MQFPEPLSERKTTKYLKIIALELDMILHKQIYFP